MSPGHYALWKVLSRDLPLARHQSRGHFQGSQSRSGHWAFSLPLGAFSLVLPNPPMWELMTDVLIKVRQVRCGSSMSLQSKRYEEVHTDVKGTTVACQKSWGNQVLAVMIRILHPIPMRGSPPPPKQGSNTPVWCPTIRLNPGNVAGGNGVLCRLPAAAFTESRESISRDPRVEG